MSSETGNRNSGEAGRFPPDALYFDSYQDKNEDGPYKTREQKLERLKQLDNQSCSRSLEEVCPNTEIKTPGELEEQIEQFEQLKNQAEYKEYCESEDRLKEAEKQQEENNDEPDQ